MPVQDSDTAEVGFIIFKAPESLGRFVASMLWGGALLKRKRPAVVRT